MSDYNAIAQVVVATLAPYLPSLMQAVSGSVARKTVDAAWEKASAVWDRAKQLFVAGSEVHGAATLVSFKPDDADRRKTLASVLADRLAENAVLADEIEQIFGGREGVQRALADAESTIRDLAQDMTGGGEQSAEAKNRSLIERVTQRKR